MLELGAQTVPLLPRKRRLQGSAFGGFTSVRRGAGSDIASSRPYRPGDPIHAIDWKSSARLSSAFGRPEFIVRERHAEEMPRIVLVVDRRPDMELYPRDLPWLDKPRAVAAVVDILVRSALNQRGLVGYLDLASHPEEGAAAGDPFWMPPRTGTGAWHMDLLERTRMLLAGGFDAPQNTVDASLEFLSAARGALPIGSFVFVISDFTAPVSVDSWERALEHGWDVVPVIVQDPVWEQSFPDVAGVLVPLSDPERGSFFPVRLDDREVELRRSAHESRLEALRTGFVGLGVDTVLVGNDGPEAVYAALDDWASGRSEMRGART